MEIFTFCFYSIDKNERHEDVDVSFFFWVNCFSSSKDDCFLMLIKSLLLRIHLVIQSSVNLPRDLFIVNVVGCVGINLNKNLVWSFHSHEFYLK